MTYWTRSMGFAAAILAVTACSGNSDAPADLGEVTFGDVANQQDQAAQPEIAIVDDLKPQPDQHTSDTVPDGAPADLGQPDLPGLDIVSQDQNGPDTIQPQEVTESDAKAVAEKAYSKCEEDADCPYPLECKTGLNNPLYGQCSLTCAEDGECPAAPNGNSVGCVYNMCVSTCGIHGGTCPEWLNCTAQEFCLEPTSTVADKGPGESCTEAAECKDGAECVEGEVTNAYCAPLCQTNEDCLAAAPEAYGQCAAAGGFNFCMFYCGMMGQNKPCPGDMKCEVVICR